MKNKSTKLVLIALLVALNIILVRFASINLGPSIRINFGFITIVIMGILFGPRYCALGAALADFIGATIFPTGGAYFPGFTLSALVTGYIYGKMFYGHKLSISRIVISNLLVILIVQFFLNTLWVSLMSGKAFIILIPARMIKSIVMLPIESLIITGTYKYISPVFMKYAEH